MAIRTMGRTELTVGREEFPLLASNPGLSYLDNAATTQKPKAVLEALRKYYEQDCANIHRSVHQLGERATAEYEAARVEVQKFLNAPSEREVLFVRGTTEGINLVAQSFARAVLKPGDEVLITGLEHHSNIVPWQMACEISGAKLAVAPINDRGEVEFEEFRRRLTPRTRIAAFGHISNALGTVNPVREMIAAARAAGAATLIDGAQAAPHAAIDVQALGCDFYAISGHKMYGPTGIGALYGRREWLEKLPPWQGGGDMIRSVTFEKTTYNELPYKFEAGTPHIAGGIGLGAAAKFLRGVGMKSIAAYEQELLAYGTELLEAIPGVRLIGTARQKAAVLSFVVEGIHPHDVGTVLDAEGVAVRAGHHCAQPVMDRFGIAATTRASLGLYNMREDLDKLAQGLQRAKELFV